MSESRIIYKGGEGEIVEKKSRFIATISPVHSEEEAVTFIERMKKKYWDARHNCSAYLIGDKNEVQRCSDDGEPSQTAGKPMLDILLGEELHNVVVVVTRYFGGTLLGTGGLVRAYSSAVKAGLEHAVIINRIEGQKYQLKTEYTDLGKIQYILGERGIPILDSSYTDQVELQIVVAIDAWKSIEEALIEGTSGKIDIQEEEHCYYGEIDGQVIILDSEKTRNI